MSENKERGAFPEVELEIEVRNKDGNLIKFYRQKARSWTKNFFSLLRNAFARNWMQLVKQDGTVDAIGSDVSIANVLGVTAGNYDTSYGIIVGSGTNPYNIDNYALQNKITGNLVYGTTYVEDFTDTGTTLYFKIARTFTNGSSSSVTISEVGLVIYANTANILIARDVLSQPITVPQGGSVTIRYVISYQYA